MPPHSSFDYTGEYDENWPLPQTLTLAQYRRVFFRPDAHFVDGNIIPRQLGDRTHSDVVGALISALAPVCRLSGYDSCLSLRLQVAPTRIRVCDFVVLHPDAPREQVPTLPPLLCIEVLSPGQTPSDELAALTDYLTMGVENVWVIDPVNRAAFIFDTAGFHMANPAKLSIPDTPIQVDLTEAFAALD